jgi:hypothetical protein
MTTEAPEKAATPAPAAQPAPATCGHQVNTSKGFKACVKEPGHKGGHASRVQARKEYVPVPVKALKTLATVPTTETAEYGGGRGRDAADRYEGEHGAVQKLADEHVAANYKAWADAGKPKMGFNDAIKARLVSRYFIDSPDEYDAVVAILRSAGRYHEVGLQIAPIKTHENGKLMVFWRAVDVQHRAGKPAMQPTQPATQPAA